MCCFPPSYLLPLETADNVVISMMPNGLFMRTILNVFGGKRKKKKNIGDNGHKKTMCSPKKRNSTPTSALFRLTRKPRKAQ